MIEQAPMSADTKLEVGWVIGLTATGATLLLLVILAGWCLRRYRRDGRVPDGLVVSTPVVGLIVLILVPAFVGTTWPTFDLDYHQWRYVSGTVATVQTRLIDQTELYAVTYTDNPDQVHRCGDTRCSVVRNGDRLGMWCIYEWQQASTPGLVCNFADHHRRPAPW